MFLSLKPSEERSDALLLANAHAASVEDRKFGWLVRWLKNLKGLVIDLLIILAESLIY